MGRSICLVLMWAVSSLAAQNKRNSDVPSPNREMQTVEDGFIAIDTPRGFEAAMCL